MGFSEPTLLGKELERRVCFGERTQLDRGPAPFVLGCPPGISGPASPGKEQNPLSLVS